MPMAFANLMAPMPSNHTVAYSGGGPLEGPSSPHPSRPFASPDGSPRASPLHTRTNSNLSPGALRPLRRGPPSPMAFVDPTGPSPTTTAAAVEGNSYAALLKKLKAKERVPPLNRGDLDDASRRPSPQLLSNNSNTPVSTSRNRSPSISATRRRSMPEPSGVRNTYPAGRDEALSRRPSQQRIVSRPSMRVAAGYGSDTPAGYVSEGKGADSAPTPSLAPADGGQARRKGRIRVVVRKRPVPSGEEDVVEVDPPVVHVNAQKVRIDLSEYTEAYQYGFDDAFGDEANNAMVYEQCGSSLIDTLFEGGSASCFAYGQTGSGKTHTMLGTEEDMGFYLLAAKDIFGRCTPDHKVSVSLFEIYCNSLFDLLNARSVVIPREDANKRVVICGLTWQDITSVSDLAYWIERGSEQRRTGSTSANEFSSRSHAVMTISVRNDKERVYGSLKLVDLAGSERAADTAAHDRQTRLEGAEINKSLLALKECIRGLDERKRHIPFRGSKLTEVLRDSFEGNSRTVMIAAVTPAAASVVHTLNTLRYAFRVKGLSIDQNVVPSKQRKSRVAPPRSKSTEPTSGGAYSILAQPLPPLFLSPSPAKQRHRSPSEARDVGAGVGEGDEARREREARRQRRHRKARSRTSDARGVRPSVSAAAAPSAEAMDALQAKVGAEIAGLRQEMMGVIGEKNEEISRLSERNDALERRLEKLLAHIATREAAMDGADELF